MLADAGLLVEAGEEKIRGGVAKRYRHPWDAGKMIAATATTRGPGAPTSRAMAQELYAVRSASTAGVRGRCSPTPSPWVTPEVWTEVFDLVTRRRGSCTPRPSRPAREGTLHVGLTAAAFLMARTTRPRDGG